MAESEDTRPAIGIDLGTTNCRVGIWLDEENRFELFSNDHGNQSTPSYVAFTETERLIGDAAKDQGSRNPANTIFDAKRLIGRKFSTLGTDSDKVHIQWPFRVACGKDDKPVIRVEYKGKEKVFPAEEVYAMILGQMKDLAEISSGSVVNGASVSVPHCFNSAQRQATRNACSMAGLETVNLVNEPVCAALAYTLANRTRPSLGEKKIMIFDLGGGSLDVTLFSIEEGVIEVKATSGDSQLGGEDFDLRLLHHFIQEITQKHERDISSHPRVMRRLKKQVERVKVALSSDMETAIDIDALLEDFDFHSSISRACFEEMNADLFGKCIQCVEECLQRAQMEKADVYEVVMIGGSTRIPKVQQLLAEFFNDGAKLKKATDDAVVCGAAVRSGISRGYKAFADYLVVDVAPMSLGLETVGGAMHVMHSRNSSIPKSCEQLFTTCYDNQRGIFIQIYEGENPRACGNMLIATMELSGIPPAPYGVPQILVRFDIDADGILTALAKDKTTGQKVEVCMEDIDLATSRVNDHVERRQRFPIQVYRPSENPHDPISPSGPHESSNFNASSPHEPSKTIETRSPELSYVPPQAVESNITVENSSQPPLAREFHNVKSRSSEPHESSNTFETALQEFPQPPPACESNKNVESRSLKIVEPPLAFEPLEFSERPQDNVEPRNVVDVESQENTQFYSFCNTVENGAGEFSAPSPPQVHGLNSYEIMPHELPEPSPALISRCTEEVRSEEFAEPIEVQWLKSAPEPSHRGDLPATPRAHESSIVVEGKPQEFSEQRQAYGSSKPQELSEQRQEYGSSKPQEFSEQRQEHGSSKPQDLSEQRQEYDSSKPQGFSEQRQEYGSSKPQEFSEQRQEYGSSNALESGPAIFPALSPASKELEDRPHEHSEPLQVHGVISYESKQLELPVPSPGSGTQVIRSDEFSVPPPAFGSSNSAEVRSQEFSSANGSSNSVESSSHISLVHKIIETVQVIGSIADFQAHKKECSTFIRRANMLVPLFVEFRDSDLSISEAVVICFSAFEAVLNTAKALLLLCNEGSKLYLILEQRKVAEQFSLVNTAFIQALDKIPSSLEIPEEVREQVDLVHSQLKRSKGLEDAVDSQLYAELTSVLDETNGRSRSPFQLTRLAESFKLDTATSLRKEFQALRGMMTAKEPPLDALVNQREFDQVYGLLNELRDLYPLAEDLPSQGHGSSNVVESSSHEFSASPRPPPRMSGSESPQAYEPRILKEVSAPPPRSSVEGRPPTDPPQVYRPTESRSQESPPIPIPTPTPQVYNSSHSSYSDDRIQFEDRSYSDAQVYRLTESRPQESPPPPPPQVYKLSHSFEDRSYSEAPPVYRPSKTFGGRPYESWDPFMSPRSSDASESRSQKFPLTQYERVPSISSSELSPVHKSGNGQEDRPQEYSSEPLQAYATSSTSESGRPESSESSPVRKSGNGQESRPQEYSSEPLQAYATSSTSESGRPESSESSPVRKSGNGQESRPQEYSSEPLQAYATSSTSESGRPESSESSPVRKSGNGQESRPQEYSSEPLQAYATSSTSESGRPESSESSPVRKSGNGQESRPQEYSSEPLQAYATSSTSESGRPESSESSPVRKSGNGQESRPQEYSSEPLQAYATSNTSESRRPESSESSPVHKSGNGQESRSQEYSSGPLQAFATSSTSESRRPESSESSPVHKSGNGQESRPEEYSSEPLQAYATSNTSESRPDEASAMQRLNSKQHEPAELSPVYKSSNASESSRPVSSEYTYKSSSASDMSSEFSNSGPLGALGDLGKVPELQRSATCATEPLNHESPRPEAARSDSCPQIRTSDSIIEDVVKKYNWDQVLEMTDNLTSRQLGKGGFGAVYLAKLENGKEVAVKILDASSQQGISEFLNEVNLLKRVNHVNLIRLLGYCQDERQVLIYEFAEEGSIWDHLQAGGTSLDWKKRLNIALQSACGLEYLHTGCSPRIIHRDIKSQNILLTKSMVAKVADFGLSKLGADQENLNKTHVTTMVKGTLGYLDPEYLKTGQLTEKSDVYSFGVILMEIITGRKPIQNSEKKCFIGDWVEEHYNPNASSRTLKTVTDPSLGGQYNPKALKRVIDVAKQCIQPFGADRPEMTDVVRALRKAQSAEQDEKKPSKWLPSFR